MILVGNKSDLEGQRIISKARAQKFAEENDVEYIETSALNGTNVSESVKLLLDTVMNRLEQNPGLTKPNTHLLRSMHDEVTKELRESNTKEKPKVSSCCSS
jgi:Ras-related protein Rab-11A